MNKSEFLTKISSMTRSEISELFDKSKVRTKLLYPVVIMKPTKNDSKDSSITRSKKGAK